MADITPRKQIRMVALAERWKYTQKDIANCKRNAQKTRFDFQKDLMHLGVHISSSTMHTMRRRLLEADR